MLNEQQQLGSENNTQPQFDFDFALKAAGFGVWELDPMTNQVKWDDRCRELFGLAEDNRLPYAQAIQHIHPQDVDRVDQAVQRAMSAQSDSHYDVTYRTIGADDGKLRWVRFIGRGYFTETGEVYRFAGVAHEVTQQILEQKALLDDQARFRSHLEQRVEQQSEQLTVATQAIHDNQPWLNRIFEQAPVAIALLEGPNYRLRLANATMYDIWQLPADHESVIGQPIFEAFPNIAGLGLEELLAQVRQTNQPVKGIEAPYASKGKPTAYVNFVYTPITSDTGEINVVVIATDVSQQVLTRQQLMESEDRYRLQSQELAAVNEELTANNEELEESNGLLVRSNDNLQRFAYVASHDLQEPLRKIQQFGDLLHSRNESLDEQGLDYLERMQSAASRMSTLIRDLLSFSRISTQRDAYISVKLNDIVDSVLTTLELSIAETEAKVVVDELPAVFGDASQLRQLFQNLLSNAIKFRRSDTAPQITVSAQTVSAFELLPIVKPPRSSSRYHRIDVADNGIGFEEKYLDRIFEVFQRLHGKNEYAGTGIGLAICERVAANHGGTITASSQLGHGATFSLYLPVVVTR